MALADRIDGDEVILMPGFGIARASAVDLFGRGGVGSGIDQSLLNRIVAENFARLM
jgi:hypothetical protein